MRIAIFIPLRPFRRIRCRRSRHKSQEYMSIYVIYLVSCTKESILLFAFLWDSAADRLIDRPLATLVRDAENAEGD